MKREMELWTKSSSLKKETEKNSEELVPTSNKEHIYAP